MSTSSDTTVPFCLLTRDSLLEVCRAVSDSAVQYTGVFSVHLAFATRSLPEDLTLIEGVLMPLLGATQESLVMPVLQAKAQGSVTSNLDKFLDEIG